MEVSLLYAKEWAREKPYPVAHILTKDRLKEILKQDIAQRDSALWALSRAYKVRDFTGKPGEVLIVYPGSAEQNMQIYVALGERETLTPTDFLNAGASLAKRLSGMTIEQIVLDLSHTGGMNAFTTLKPFIAGIAIGAYTFSKYVSHTQPFPLGTLEVIIPETLALDASRQAVAEAAYNVTASNIARHLTNEAANNKTPEKFERVVRKLLAEHNLRIETIAAQSLIDKDLRLIHAVGRAGSAPPRLMLISGQSRAKAFTLGLVGKAVTFDAGGLMLKSKTSLPYMGEDIAGAAAMVGLLSVIDHLHLDYNVVCAIPIAENLIDAKAYRPSDILQTPHLSVEVNNTDAEGRLLLADSFNYLQDVFQVDMIIDVATLTGAISRALGNRMAGYFTNNEALAALLCRAAERSMEKFWRMPLARSYDHQLDSDFADVRNDGGEPKAITAALFLHRFIRKGIPWLHLDIGQAINAPAWDLLYGGKSYANGFPVLTLIELLKELNQGRFST